MGRTFVAGEDRPGAESVVVLSYGLWQRELAADPVSLGVAAAALLGAGVAASVIPARRATRVSPVESLRAE